jgi:hypothetical protein
VSAILGDFTWEGGRDGMTMGSESVTKRGE